MKLNRRSTAALALFAAIAAALVLAGCDNTYGVFHGIQTETKQVGTDQFKNTTVKALGEDSANYYAVMAKVFYRAKSDGTWAVLPIGAAQDTDYYCAGFATDGAGTIYVAIADAASGTALKGIYARSDSTSTWTELDATAIASSKKVDALFYAGDTLFVEAHTDAENASEYDLYCSKAGAAFAGAGLSSLSLPIQGMAYDGSNYLAMTNSAIYSSAVNTAFSASATNTPGSGETLCGIASDHSGAILVTTSDGNLYSWNGSTWSNPANTSSTIKLGTLCEVPQVPGGSSYSLIISRHDSSYGYYEYDSGSAISRSGSASEAVFVPTSSNYTTAIYEKPVLAIHYSKAADTILIALAAQGTNGYALYSNTKSTTDSAWGGWTAE